MIAKVDKATGQVMAHFDPVYDEDGELVWDLIEFEDQGQPVEVEDYHMPDEDMASFNRKIHAASAANPNVPTAKINPEQPEHIVHNVRIFLNKKTTPQGVMGLVADDPTDVEGADGTKYALALEAGNKPKLEGIAAVRKNLEKAVQAGQVDPEGSMPVGAMLQLLQASEQGVDDEG